ncbi:MAG: hypothetical protein KC912_08585 [Proteobacteria bacterium]|nr:hypothetical protein [Pseudomonadota bacterium]
MYSCELLSVTDKELTFDVRPTGDIRDLPSSRVFAASLLGEVLSNLGDVSGLPCADRIEAALAQRDAVSPIDVPKSLYALAKRWDHVADHSFLVNLEFGGPFSNPPTGTEVACVHMKLTVAPALKTAVPVIKSLIGEVFLALADDHNSKSVKVEVRERPPENTLWQFICSDSPERVRLPRKGWFAGAVDVHLWGENIRSDSTGSEYAWVAKHESWVLGSVVARSCSVRRGRLTIKGCWIDQRGTLEELEEIIRANPKYPAEKQVKRGLP